MIKLSIMQNIITNSLPLVKYCSRIHYFLKITLKYNFMNVVYLFCGITKYVLNINIYLNIY